LTAHGIALTPVSFLEVWAGERSSPLQMFFKIRLPFASELHGRANPCLMVAFGMVVIEESWDRAARRRTTEHADRQNDDAWRNRSLISSVVASYRSHRGRPIPRLPAITTIPNATIRHWFAPA